MAAAVQASGWARATAHNRAQVLYYVAENLAAVIIEAEVPVARTPVGACLQAHVRFHQAQLGQSDLARQKWPELELQREATELGKVKRLPNQRVVTADGQEVQEDVVRVGAFRARRACSHRL